MNPFSPIANLFRAKKAAPAAPATDRVVTGSGRERAGMMPFARNLSPQQVKQILQQAQTGDWTAQRQLFDLMLDTWPRLQKNVAELSMAVNSTRFNVTPYARKGEEPTATAIERAALAERALAEFLPSPFDTAENNFEQTISTLCEAFPKGYSVQEILWERRGGFILPRACYRVHPSFYGLAPQSSRLQLRTDGSTFKDFPADKFLVAQWRNGGDNPATHGVLRSLAWWWGAVMFGRDWLLNYAEIFGVPLRWATYDRNASPQLQQSLADALENLGSAGWAAFPDGTKLDIKEASKGGGDNPQAHLIDLADKTCDILILGQTLTTDVSGSGSRALGDVHADVKAQRVAALAKWTADILSYQLLPALLRLNYGDDHECPIVSPALDTASDPKALAERDAVLLQSGVELPSEWLYKRHDIPRPHDGEHTIKQHQAAPPPSMFGKAALLPLSIQAIQATADREAAAASEKLLTQVLEDLTGVSAEWLGPVRPHFTRLMESAKAGRLTDADLVAVLEKAGDMLPELFEHLDTAALAEALEKAGGAAMVNGAVARDVKTPTKVAPIKAKAKKGGRL